MRLKWCKNGGSSRVTWWVWERFEMGKIMNSQKCSRENWKHLKTDLFAQNMWFSWLRLRLFWLKLIFGNHFPENKAFGWYVKFGQTENVFSLTENSAKNDWNHFQPLFSLQSFSSSLSHARVSHTRTASVKPSLLRPTHQAKRNDPHRPTTIAISPVTGTAPIDVDHDRDRADRNRRFARLRSCRSASIVIIEIGEIAIAISPISREVSIAIVMDDSRDRDHDLTIEIGEIAIAISPIKITPIAILLIEIAPIAISPRKYAVLLGFIWVFRNWWHYVFVW